MDLAQEWILSTSAKPREGETLVELPRGFRYCGHPMLGHLHGRAAAVADEITGSLRAGSPRGGSLGIGSGDLARRPAFEELHDALR